MHIFRFHIFSWGIAALLVLLPALIHKFGIAAEGNWCWIRGEELMTRIGFHDLFLLLATTVFIASCILTAKIVSFLSSMTVTITTFADYAYAVVRVERSTINGCLSTVACEQ